MPRPGRLAPVSSMLVIPCVLLVTVLASPARGQAPVVDLQLHARPFSQVASESAAVRILDDRALPGSGSDGPETYCTVWMGFTAAEYVLHILATLTLHAVNPVMTKRWFKNTVPVDSEGTATDSSSPLCSGGGGDSWRFGDAGCMALGYARKDSPGMLAYHAFIGIAGYTAAFAALGRGDNKWKSRRFRNGVIAIGALHALWSALAWYTSGDSHIMAGLTPVFDGGALLGIALLTYDD